MLAVSSADVVLWLHVLAACVWIGGQATVAVLIPLLRGQPELVAEAGKRFGFVAWSAFAVLVVTGLVNMHNVGLTFGNLTETATGRTLEVKLLLVLISGLAAATHSLVAARRTASVPLSASLGALSLLSAVYAALFGVAIVQS